VSLAGTLDIGELAALLQLATVAVVNNSVAAHLAAAVDTPVVDLYALTNPQHTPWGVAHCVLNHDVACRYCFKSVCPQGHHRCLATVAPEEVVDAVRRLTADVPRAPAAAAAGDSSITVAA
jgi:ADP-heptose:LPS heptosyltransferase